MAPRYISALVGIVVLFDSMFYAAVAPLLAGFVDDYDLTKAQAGVLSGSYAVGALVAAPVAGWFTARVGPRRALSCGLVLMAGAGIAFAVADNIVVLDASRFVQGLGGTMTWTSAFAWVVVATPPARRGQAIGQAVGLAAAGTVLGPVLGSVASALGRDVVFSAAGVLSLVLTIWALALPSPRRESATGNLLGALRQRSVIGALVLSMVPCAALGLLEVLLPLRLSSLGASAGLIGATFIAGAVLTVLGSRLAGGAVDRNGSLVVTWWGLVIGGTALLVLQIPTGLALLVCIAPLVMLSIQPLVVVAMSMLADAADRAGLDQGYAFAGFSVAFSVGAVIGGIGGSAVAATTSDVVAYVAIVVGYVAVAIAIRARLRASSAACTSELPAGG